MIDFTDFKQAVTADPVGYLHALLPGGRFDRATGEYVTADFNGGEGQSCRISTKPDKLLLGGDFATGQTVSGPIDVACERFNIPRSQPQEAVKRALECWRGGQDYPQRENPSPLARSAAPFKPLLPPEGSCPDMKIGGRDPVLVSHYHDPWCNWALAFIIARYEPKLFIPFTYGELDGVVGWHKKMRPGQRPLLGVMDMKLHYEANKQPLPGLVVEGEKSYEAARRMVGDRFHLFTWHGGAGAVDKADWRTLDGFPAIYLWPDNDAPGRKAMQRIAEHLAHYRENKIYFVTPPDDVPGGWDAADAEAEGRTVI